MCTTHTLERVNVFFFCFLFLSFQTIHIPWTNLPNLKVYFLGYSSIHAQAVAEASPHAESHVQTVPNHPSTTVMYSTIQSLLITSHQPVFTRIDDMNHGLYNPCPPLTMGSSRFHHGLVIGTSLLRLDSIPQKSNLPILTTNCPVVERKSTNKRAGDGIRYYICTYSGLLVHRSPLPWPPVSPICRQTRLDYSCTNWHWELIFVERL